MSVYIRSVLRPDRLSRRSALAGLAVMATGIAGTASAAPVPPDGSLVFRIRRKGSEIGQHAVRFRQNGDALRVDVTVEIVLKFGPIPVYRYNHRASEDWRGGALVAADGKTNDDGTAHAMTARLEPDGLQVDGSDSGRYVAPLGALTANHWNQRELDGPMINPQGGKLLRPVIVAYPEEPIALASGRKIPARRYNFSGDAKLDLWYDRSGTWSRTRFIAEDGSEVFYDLVD